MLVDFSVSNFLSIRKKITLTMASSRGAELKDSNTFDPEVLAIPELVKSSVIYGPNASGKSNFVRAMGVMEKIVRESASNRQVGEIFSITPFRLNEYSRKEPSEFEVTFVSQGVKYQYGFVADGKRVFEEWLFAYPKGRAQTWIERSFDLESQEYIWGGMDKLTGKKQVWQSATRSNALFLSTAIQLNNQQLIPVFNWFTSNLHVYGFGSLEPGFTARACDENSDSENIVTFLKEADIDIESIKIEKKEFDSKMLPESMPESLKNEIEKDFQNKVLFSVQTGHKSDNGDLVYFDLDDESDGTKKLFSIAGPWLDTLRNGFVLFVDELNDNLHPVLVRYLVNLFHDKSINTKNAQLIFTTHDTSILNQDIFRRDQIWFCEKNEEQSTNLFPLTDFRPRKGYENLERGYLSGRYGALPYPKELIN